MWDTQQVSELVGVRKENTYEGSRNFSLLETFSRARQLAAGRAAAGFMPWAGGLAQMSPEAVGMVHGAGLQAATSA